MKEEAAPFRKIAAGRPGLLLLLTGVGRRNAQRAVRDFLTAHSPALVLTCGFAGGLNPALKLGDVLFEPIGPASAQPADLLGPAGGVSWEKLTAAGAKPATFFCTDRIAVTVAEKKVLRAQTGADAVEMESGAIQALCRERATPCLTLRVISDTAGEALPLDFNALAKPDLSPDFGKLLLAVARSPRTIGALRRLHQNTTFAAQRLAGVLERLFT